MTKHLSLLLAALFTLLTVPAYAETAATIAEIKYPALAFKPKKTKRVALKNGMVLHLLEDHELPLVEIQSLVRIGSAYEPPEKSGLAMVTGHLWRAGATRKISPEQMDERLEFIGANLETSIGVDSGSITLSVLKKNLDEGLNLFADLIMNPAFEENRFRVVKEQALEGLKRENDEPDAVADREFNREVYKGHPFGRFPTMRSVEGITVEDCRQFYRSHVGPENFVIGIAGDFDADKMAKRFEALFAGFAYAPSKLGKLPPVRERATPGIYFIDKQIDQTVVRLGHLGITRKNPDFYAVRVMDYILGGGGFSSRLMKDVRTVKGLAYSVWSYFVGGDSDLGTFVLGGETKAATTFEFIDSSKSIIREVSEKGVTPQEIDNAKEALINSFIFAFDKNSDILSRYLWIEYYNMPRDYLESYRDRIQAVTLDKVREVAAKYLHPDSAVILAVGKKDAIFGALEKLGPVQTVDLAQ